MILEHGWSERPKAFSLLDGSVYTVTHRRVSRIGENTAIAERRLGEAIINRADWEQIRMLLSIKPFFRNCGYNHTVFDKGSCGVHALDEAKNARVSMR